MRYLFYFLHLVGSNRTLDTFCQNESKNNNKKAILLLDENLTDDSNSVFVAESLPKNWRLLGVAHNKYIQISRTVNFQNFIYVVNSEI